MNDQNERGARILADRKRAAEKAALKATLDFVDASNAFKLCSSARNFRQLVTAATAHQDVQAEIDEVHEIEYSKRPDAE